MLSYQQAREIVIWRLEAIPRTPATESVPLREAMSRALARDILSDRDYPPFDRSIRDGYAVRSADSQTGARLRCMFGRDQKAMRTVAAFGGKLEHARTECCDDSARPFRRSGRSVGRT